MDCANKTQVPTTAKRVTPKLDMVNHVSNLSDIFQAMELFHLTVSKSCLGHKKMGETGEMG